MTLGEHFERNLAFVEIKLGTGGLAMALAKRLSPVICLQNTIQELLVSGHAGDGFIYCVSQGQQMRLHHRRFRGVNKRIVAGGQASEPEEQCNHIVVGAGFIISKSQSSVAAKKLQPRVQHRGSG